MRDYEDRWGNRHRDWGRDWSRDRDESRDYARRDYEYRGGGGGYRQDEDHERGYGSRGYGTRNQGSGMERARDRGADYAGGMMEDMRRFAQGDYDSTRGRDDDYRSRSDYRDRYGEDRSYGYERDRSMSNRGYGGGYGGDYARGRPGWSSERDRSDWGRSDWGRDRNDRGWLERAGDEVASWFGDEDAERRRRMDEARDHRGRGPRGYTRSDDRIRDDLNDRLTDDRYVDASDIDISVNNGEVTLTGHVDHRSIKRRAEDIAESISGVTHVQNNLRVRQSTGTTSGTGMGGSTSAGASAMAGMGSGTGTTGTTGTTGAGTTTGGTTTGGSTTTGTSTGTAGGTTRTGGTVRT